MGEEEVREDELKRLIAGAKRGISRLGDMRPGHLSVQYRRSGGREIGYNQLSFTFDGRSRTEYVRDDDLPRVRKEGATFRRFKELCDELVALSIEASRARTRKRIDSEEDD